MLFFRLFIRTIFFLLLIAFNALIIFYYYCLSKSNSFVVNQREQFDNDDEHRHIWCLNHYDPKNQVEDFVKCALVASMMNLTLILPPFFAHFRDETNDLQWFGNFYNLKSFVPLVRFVQLDRWIKTRVTMNKRLNIDCYLQQIELIGNTIVYGKRMRQRVEEHFQIQIDFQRFVNLSSNFDFNELETSSKFCRSIYLHLDSSTLNSFFSPPHPFVEKLFEHLHRTPLIERIADKWKNLLPKLVENRNSTILAVTHFPQSHHLSTSSSSYIKQILYLMENAVQFTHLHIICDDLDETDLDYLSANLPVSFTTTKNLYDRVKNLFDKNLIDVLEQEIAYQAKVFLAVPRTSYSTTVIMQKIYQAKGVVYLFTLGGIGSPYNITRENTRYLGI